MNGREHLDFYLSRRNATPDRVAEVIRNFGIAVLPEYLPKSFVSSLIAEYVDFFGCSDLATFDSSSGNGTIRSVKAQVLADAGSRFENWTAMFRHDFLARCVASYCHSMNLEIPATAINEKFEVEHNDQMGPSKNSGLHFDRVASIKVITYLNDVTEGGGGLRAVPRSHYHTKLFALEQFKTNPNPLCLQNFLVDEADLRMPVSTVSAPAGTIIFLDTFCLHAGGSLSRRLKRSVIRGVTWMRPMTDALLLSGITETQRAKLNEIVLPNFHHPYPLDANISLHPEAMYTR